MKKFCSQCGNQLPEQGKFCPKCGTAVEQQIEEVELGEVTKINTKKKSFSFNSLNMLPKQKVGMVVGAIVLAILVFFFMNKTPLQGHWKSSSEYSNDEEINIKGKQAELIMDIDSDTELIISGKLRKKNKNEYILPLEIAHIKFIGRDTDLDQDDFDDSMNLLKEEISDLSLSTSERKKVEKFIAKIKYNGSEVSYETSVAEMIDIANVLDDTMGMPIDLEYLGEGFILTKKSDRKLVVTGTNDMIELDFVKVK